MAGSDSVEKLRDMCGLSAEECEAALKAHGDEVEAALAGLIDEGKVTSQELNPDTVSDELFARAARRQELETYRRFLDPKQGLGGMFGNMLKGVMPEEDEKRISSAFKGLMAERFGGRT